VILVGILCSCFTLCLKVINPVEHGTQRALCEHGPGVKLRLIVDLNVQCTMLGTVHTGVHAQQRFTISEVAADWYELMIS